MKEPVQIYAIEGWAGEAPNAGEEGRWLHDCDTKVSLGGIEL